jgi:hypothetical protein
LDNQPSGSCNPEQPKISHRSGHRHKAIFPAEAVSQKNSGNEAFNSEPFQKSVRLDVVDGGVGLAAFGYAIGCASSIQILGH